MAQILEVCMIVAFGLYWPNSILTTLRNKSTKGKSLAFLLLMDIGYVCGIAGKLISGNFVWYVLFFYLLNFLMVTTDLCLYFHYLRKERSVPLPSIAGRPECCHTRLQELEDQVRRDPLTKMLHKFAFAGEVSRRLGKGTGSSGALLMLDLDDFKSVNDRHGHLYGDEVLCRAASAILKTLQSGELAGRFGGDEFMVLLDSRDPDAAARRCAALIQALKEIPDCPLSCSIGVAQFPADSWETLLHRADMALYEAKNQGGDRWIFR